MSEIKETLSFKEVKRNEKLNYAEVFLISPFIVVIQQFVPMLATQLGASPILLGWVTSGSALMLAITAMMSNWYRSRAPEGIRALVMPFVIFRSMLIWIPLVLLLPAYRAEVLILLTIISNFFAGLGQITFVTLLPRYTWRNRLSSLVSFRWTALGIGMSISLAGLGFVLNAFPMPVNYFVMCGIALVITIISSLCLVSIRPAPPSAGSSHSATSRPNIKEILAHKPAAYFLLVTLLTQIALNAAVPLITLRLVREMGLSDFEFGITNSVLWAGIAIASVAIPTLVRKFGTRVVFAASGIGLAAQVFLLITASSAQATWIASFIGGIASVMFQVTQFSLIVDSAPPESLDNFISVQGMALNIGIFIGPLLMSGLVNVGMSVAIGLAICGVARISSTALILAQPQKGER
ncbi:MAG TPA: MFS transporter [Thermoflexales bacterium]|nr:MFS transporter [Thermoflexales bacterium]HRA01124.1 MFS transporter [Thermoflexales bacterium]